MRLQASNLKSDEHCTRMALPFLSKGHEPGGDGNENQSMNHSWFCACALGSPGTLSRTSWAETLMHIVCFTLVKHIHTPFSKGILRYWEMPGPGNQWWHCASISCRMMKLWSDGYWGLWSCARELLIWSQHQETQIKGQSANLSKNNSCWMHSVVPYFPNETWRGLRCGPKHSRVMRIISNETMQSTWLGRIQREQLNCRSQRGYLQHHVMQSKFTSPLPLNINRGDAIPEPEPWSNNLLQRVYIAHATPFPATTHQRAASDVWWTRVRESSGQAQLNHTRIPGREWNWSRSG